jgi:ABC-type glycerol-3-phosphate transport system substrate-binding protein
MRKIAALILAAFLLAACGNPSPDPARRETEPLRLYEDEVEFWQRLMEGHTGAGVIQVPNAALIADAMILELRKRNGRE